jgi:tRNA uridine 5-carboxymethylaminomethyl modification enzyme
MITSRSEFRLLLRQDNAEERLIEHGRACGLISEERYRDFLTHRQMVETEKSRLSRTHVRPISEVNDILTGVGSTPLSTGASMADLLRRPQITYDILTPLDPDRPDLHRRETDAVETEIKYEGYVRRQEDAARRMRKMDDVPLSPDLDYSAIAGLRTEAAQKLTAVRPLSIGQAQRISGVNPADITVLMIYLGQKK